MCVLFIYSTSTSQLFGPTCLLFMSAGFLCVRDFFRHVRKIDSEILPSS
ncbi:protein of unknown function [Pseudomonas mediterranea]